MNPVDLQCWKCGTSLADVLLPLSRMAKCKACNADLHVCRLCQFFDPTVSNSCREPIAEKVTNKETKNFCGYLQPTTNAYKSSNSDYQTTTISKLDELFGLNSTDEKRVDSTVGKITAEKDSRNKLEALFNLDKNS